MRRPALRISSVLQPLSGGTSWITATYTDPILHVAVDLSGQGGAFTKSKKAFCRPQSYCEQKSDGSCGCKAGSGCTLDADCAWGPNDIDCPTDPANPNVMNCFGFSFTMPANPPPAPLPPPDSLFKTFENGDPYFSTVTFEDGKSISPYDVCVYTPPLPEQRGEPR